MYRLAIGLCLSDRTEISHPDRHHPCDCKLTVRFATHCPFGHVSVVDLNLRSAIIFVVRLAGTPLV
jgi:hypothetical protein